MRNDSPFMKVWRTLSPIILYYVILTAVSYVASFFLTYMVYSDLPATADSDAYLEAYWDAVVDATVPIYLIAGLVTIPFLLRMRKKDLTYRPYIGNKADLNKATLVLCPIVGAFCCLAASLLVTVSVMGTGYEDTLYDESSEIIFSASLVLQIVVVGVVLPIVEELIFRGLIYSRLRDYTSFKWGIIISSALFGLYHGTLVQMVYGFVMGLLFVCVYEMYQTLLAPILCHIGANVITIVLEIAEVEVSSITSGLIGAIICLALLYVFFRLMQKYVHVGQVSNPTFIDPRDRNPYYNQNGNNPNGGYWNGGNQNGNNPNGGYWNGGNQNGNNQNGGYWNGGNQNGNNQNGGYWNGGNQNGNNQNGGYWNGNNQNGNNQNGNNQNGGYLNGNNQDPSGNRDSSNEDYAKPQQRYSVDDYYPKSNLDDDTDEDED